ncbi:hypothetical protein BROUX41_002255 [Berkeleyomyces rouxiae]|uniref:uncharacterized protein n=1 Tax=Berkeleyomyces rouxiae TaxID=2035830 RepID=UPI003B7F0A60
MCGRYAQALRPSQVRQQLQDEDMPVDEAPEDGSSDAPDTTYNLAPSNRGLVYRVNSARNAQLQTPNDDDGTVLKKGARHLHKLQTMKWGLVPSWMKRPPDYKFTMRTINCRSDSLAGSSGMWTSMKTHKRCIVIAQGFFEWLNKGKEKVPHYVKRADGKLLCMAGLWDGTQYEDGTLHAYRQETLYTYTIVTTESNAQLRFLHDRMPVILDPGSDALRMWLDPSKTTWGPDLQDILQPFAGDLEVYPVTHEVGKVGTDSPRFVVPVDSRDNKRNIANFFERQNIKQQTPPTTKRPKHDDEFGHVKIKSEPLQDVVLVEESTGASDTASHKRQFPNEPAGPSSPSSKKQILGAPRQKQHREIISSTHNTKQRTLQKSRGKSDASKGHAKITSFFDRA